MRKTAIAILSMLFIATVASSQDAKKPLSPPAKAEATLQGKKVTIDYSAPSKRNRVIMGGLVPYGQVWRTGANAATTLTTEADLMIGDLHVPKGTYTIYSIPGEKEWTLIINKQTGQWGTEYNAAQDLGRTKMTVTPVKDTVETFVIGIDKNLTLTWENTRASVPISVH